MPLRTLRTPQAQRPSQIVHESEIVSPEGNHVTIVMERVSTGGNRHAAEFKRSSSAAMSGAERKKRKLEFARRCSLTSRLRLSALMLSEAVP